MVTEGTAQNTAVSLLSSCAGDRLERQKPPTNDISTTRVLPWRGRSFSKNGRAAMRSRRSIKSTGREQFNGAGHGCHCDNLFEDGNRSALSPYLPQTGISQQRVRCPATRMSPPTGFDGAAIRRHQPGHPPVERQSSLTGRRPTRNAGLIRALSPASSAKQQWAMVVL